MERIPEHHPEVLWQTVRSLVVPGMAVFMADLRRPASAAEAQRIVEDTCPHEPPVLKRDFFNSLCAAFEPHEVQAQLRQAGLEGLAVSVQPPSHMLVHGFPEGSAGGRAT
jgi:hypothetical protein